MVIREAVQAPPAVLGVEP